MFKLSTFRAYGHVWKSPFILIALLILGGCAISHKSVGPEGEEVFIVDCSVSWSDIGYCLEEGTRRCGAAGYEIIAGDMNNPEDNVKWDYGLFDFPGVSRVMTVRCKNAKKASDTAASDAYGEGYVSKRLDTYNDEDGMLGEPR